jgi:type VI protein secretion system component Hcp
MKPIRIIRAMTLALLLPALLLGQEPLSPTTTAALASTGPLSTTTVQIDGLNCTTASGFNSFHAVTWSVGVTDLAVSKLFDECSPALFGDVALGARINTVLLTEKNSQGVPQMSVKLEKVLASTYQLVGNQSDASPVEQLSFAYGRITIKNLVTGVSFCYDRQSRTRC